MKKGFTLVETLVAIAVLLVAITGAYSAAETGLSGATYARDQVTAFNLAESGIEEIRNLRDANGLSGQPWLTGIAASQSDACYFGSSCTVDATTGTLISCASGSCPPVRTDSASGLYGYNASWSVTPFTETITLTQVTADEVQIVSTVTWSKGLSTRTFRVRDNIFNWQ